jgi:hypothetical protein
VAWNGSATGRRRALEPLHALRGSRSTRLFLQFVFAISSGRLVSDFYFADMPAGYIEWT